METASQRSRIAAFALLVLAVIAGTQVVTIANTVVPSEATNAAIWTFFVSLWIVTSVFCTLLIHLAKSAVFQRHLLRRPLHISLRQGALIAAVFVISRYFTFINILSIWDIIPLVAAAFLIEFFFQAEKKPLARISHASLK